MSLKLLHDHEWTISSLLFGETLEKFCKYGNWLDKLALPQSMKVPILVDSNHRANLHKFVLGCWILLPIIHASYK